MKNVLASNRNKLSQIASNLIKGSSKELLYKKLQLRRNQIQIKYTSKCPTQLIDEVAQFFPYSKTFELTSCESANDYNKTTTMNMIIHQYTKSINNTF